jgi:hypothetical protein
MSGFKVEAFAADEVNRDFLFHIQFLLQELLSEVARNGGQCGVGMSCKRTAYLTLDFPSLRKERANGAPDAG